MVYIARLQRDNKISEILQFEQSIYTYSVLHFSGDAARSRREGTAEELVNFFPGNQFTRIDQDKPFYLHTKYIL